jgi:hypothetical protein
MCEIVFCAKSFFFFPEKKDIVRSLSSRIILGLNFGIIFFGAASHIPGIGSPKLNSPYAKSIYDFVGIILDMVLE